MEESVSDQGHDLGRFVDAVRSESTEELGWFIKSWGERVAEVEFIGRAGNRRRPLDIAAGMHWVEGVRLLLNAGCLPAGRTKEKQSWSAAERAVYSVGMASSGDKGSNADVAWRVLGMLREAGADLGGADESGLTLLMLAAGRLGVGQVMELAEMSEVHARDFAGDGILRYAVGRGGDPDELPLKLMERWGLDPHAKNRDFKSAVDFAMDEGCSRTAKAMEAKWMEIVAKREAAQIALAVGEVGGSQAKGPRRV